MTKHPRVLLSLAAAALVPALSVAATAQAVIVVDDSGGPGVDHTSLQAAVDAAAPGDVIVVKDGTYGPTTIDGVSVRIYGENDPSSFGGAQVIQLTIRNIGASQIALVNGLGIPDFGGATGVDVESCAGTVWLEDLLVRVGGPPSSSGAPALRVVDSGAVVVSDCSFEGQPYQGIGGFNVFGGPGLSAVDSTVHVYDSNFRAGTYGTNSPGAPGLSCSASFVFASDSTFQGGEGGRGTNNTLPDCSGMNGEQGGAGISASGASQVILLDSQGSGGPGGPPGADQCFYGPGGAASSVAAPATLTDLNLTWPARHYAITNPIVSGAAGTLEFTATPGELCWGVFSIDEGPLYTPSLSGTNTLAGALFFQYFGTVPAGGTLSVPITVNLPGGKPYVVIYEQGLFFSLDDTFVLGTPRASLILGSAL